MHETGLGGSDGVAAGLGHPGAFGFKGIEVVADGNGVRIGVANQVEALQVRIGGGGRGDADADAAGVGIADKAKLCIGRAAVDVTRASHQAVALCHPAAVGLIVTVEVVGGGGEVVHIGHSHGIVGLHAVVNGSGDGIPLVGLDALREHRGGGEGVRCAVFAVGAVRLHLNVILGFGLKVFNSEALLSNIACGSLPFAGGDGSSYDDVVNKKIVLIIGSVLDGHILGVGRDVNAVEMPLTIRGCNLLTPNEFSDVVVSGRESNLECFRIICIVVLIVEFQRGGLIEGQFGRDEVLRRIGTIVESKTIATRVVGVIIYASTAVAIIKSPAVDAILKSFAEDNIHIFSRSVLHSVVGDIRRAGPADGGGVVGDVGGSKRGGSGAGRKGGEAGASPVAFAVGAAVVAHPDVISNFGLKVGEIMGGCGDTGKETVLIEGFGHTAQFRVIQVVALMQLVGSDPSPCGGGSGTGDIGHSEACGHLFARDGGEVGHVAPVAIVILAAFGTDIGIVVGALCQIFEGVGVLVLGHFNRSDIVRIEVCSGAVSNLPGFLVGTGGPAKCGCMGSDVAGGKGGGSNAGDFFDAHIVDGGRRIVSL